MVVNWFVQLLLEIEVLGFCPAVPESSFLRGCRFTNLVSVHFEKQLTADKKCCKASVLQSNNCERFANADTKDLGALRETQPTK